jgi:hypothetical protein
MPHRPSAISMLDLRNSTYNNNRMQPALRKLGPRITRRVNNNLVIVKLRLAVHHTSQHQVHRSRHNSFDGGRYPVTTTTAPTPQQQPYAHAPQHQGAPLSMQYQQSQHGIQERFESSYERDRRMLEGERRMQEERERRILEERRLQEEAHYPRR